MSMNKRFKVTFNFTATLSDVQESSFMESLIGMAKYPERGQYFDNILIAALTHGPEGAFEQVLKQEIRKLIKGSLAEECAVDSYGMKVSPARVEVIR